MQTQEQINEIETLKGEIGELKQQIEDLENCENEQEYDDYLDEVCEVVKIGTLSYNPSQVLKAVDKIAYNCGQSEFNDEKLTELNNELAEKEQELKDLVSEGL